MRLKNERMHMQAPYIQTTTTAHRETDNNSNVMYMFLYLFPSQLGEASRRTESENRIQCGLVDFTLNSVSE